MADERAIEESLLHELHQLQEQVAQLKSSEAQRRRTEEKLRESEEKYRLLIEDLPVGISEILPSGHIVYQNARALEILGYQFSDLPRLLIEDLYADPADWSRQVVQLREHGFHTDECMMRRKDGRCVWIKNAMRSIGGHSGERVRYLGILEDITEARYQTARRLALQHVREEVWKLSGVDDIERLLLAVRKNLETMGVPFENCGINVVDASADPPEVRFHSMSAQGQWIDSSGEKGSETVLDFWRRAEPIYRRDLEVEDPYDEAEMLLQVFGHSVRSVLDIPFSHGTLAFNSALPGAFSERDIEIMQELAGALSEGFRRLEDLRQLANSEARYRSLVETPDFVAMLMEPDGRYLYMSPRMEEWTGYPPEAFYADRTLGQQVAHPDDLDAILDAYAQAVQGHIVRSLEFRFHGKDGTYRWGSESIFPIYDSDGHVQALQAIFVDITDRKRAEADKAQLEEQLRQSQKMEAIGHLAGGIAHDFNNLITVVKGYSEFLMEDLEAEDPRRQDAAEIHKAGQRAASLISQLLAFSRRQVLEPDVLDLNEVVADLDKMLRRLIGEDIELTTSTAPQLGRVYADRGQVEQIIVNLSVNARDAMPQGGRLTIETANVDLDESEARTHVDAEPGAYVRLRVRDTGLGMDAETQSHIFEPFFTTKEVGKGTGLGLAMIYGIVKQSKGHIQVQSRSGRGTTFEIYLPRLENPVQLRPKEQGSSQPQQGTETILLVEDEDTVRNLARRLLTKNGYTVLEASDGASALEVCQQYEGPIHLLLTDVIMPGMSGRILAERLRDVRPDARVVYMSGYTEEAFGNRGLLTEDTFFIQKPLSESGLTQKVRQALEAG